MRDKVPFPKSGHKYIVVIYNSVNDVLNAFNYLEVAGVYLGRGAGKE